MKPSIFGISYLMVSWLGALRKFLVCYTRRLFGVEKPHTSTANRRRSGIFFSFRILEVGHIIGHSLALCSQLLLCHDLPYSMAWMRGCCYLTLCRSAFILCSDLILISNKWLQNTIGICFQLEVYVLVNLLEQWSSLDCYWRLVGPKERNFVSWHWFCYAQHIGCIEGSCIQATNETNSTNSAGRLGLFPEITRTHVWIL